MGDEAMLEAQLDMSLDDLIAQGSKLNKSDTGGRRQGGAGRDRGRTGGRAPRNVKGTDSMEVDEPAPKELKVTIRNNLKPQGGVSKKSAPARPKQPFKNAAKAVKVSDEKPRPRVDLDSMPWSHDMFKLEGPSKPRMMNPSRHGRGKAGGSGSSERLRPESTGKRTKLMISNLADEVDNQDIQELFSRIGPLKSAQVTYDRTDRPTGFAEVVYNTEEHAKAAYEAYNGVALDGLKMSIKIVAERSREDGAFRLSSGIEVTDQRNQRGSHPHGTQPRGRGSAGRLKSSARALDIDMDAD